jgi:cob(I)alamin adenosyltransferase
MGGMSAPGTSPHGGDKGMTSLLSGERVFKTHPRVEACGDLDELSSVLGVVAAGFPADQEGLRREVQAVQADLLSIGALVAARPESSAFSLLRPLGMDRVAALESSMVRMEEALPTLQSFVIPGGHPSAAWAHLARTVCRRAERRVAALGADDPGGAARAVSTGAGGSSAPGSAAVPAIPASILPYLNRLSSWLFDLARWCNRLNGVADISWKG